MKTLSKEHTINFFSKECKPSIFTNLGEIVLVEVNDCYDNQIKTENDLRPDIDINKMNLATGPIFVNSIKSGDTLCIEIEKIKTNDYGIMVASPGLGPLGNYVEKSSTRIIPIQNERIIFTENISLPMEPMIGVIGVAPESGEVHTAIPGSHGGNMDTREIKEGNKVYLPVYTDGALVAIGDLHAAMRDGELSGTGLETSGEVQVKFTKSNISLLNPVIEDTSSFYFVASGTSYKEAINSALLDVTECLKKKKELSFEDSYRLISITCDLKVSQIVNKLITIKIRVPKTILPSL